jgi:hypothetical protein
VSVDCGVLDAWQTYHLALNMPPFQAHFFWGRGVWGYVTALAQASLFIELCSSGK